MLGNFFKMAVKKAARDTAVDLTMLGVVTCAAGVTTYVSDKFDKRFPSKGDLKKPEDNQTINSTEQANPSSRNTYNHR